MVHLEVQSTNTFPNTKTYPKLAAHTFIGFDEPILVVHHDTTLVFTFGVITKSDGNGFGLIQWLRSAHARIDGGLKPNRKSKIAEKGLTESDHQ